MNIVEYLNEKDGLEAKEKRLFDIINLIDEESYKLFSEVTDLDLNSFYKLDNLYMRMDNLSVMLDQASYCYNYLITFEKNSLDYPARKLIIKKLLALFISSVISMVNVSIGLGSFIIISILANKSFLKEITSANRRKDALKKLDLSTISITLENATNLLEGKMNRLYAMKESEEISQDIIITNNYIASYLLDKLSNEEIETLPSNCKQIIIKILQKDLSSNSDNIYELLSELRNKNDSEIKLTKQLN